MREKGIGCNCYVSTSWVPTTDDMNVTIRCRDIREGVTDVEKTMTFKENAQKLFPKDYGDDYMRAWWQIETWLFSMGIHEACHAHVIDTILKCSQSQFSDPLSVQLTVFVEIKDVFSYVSKDSRLHSRDNDDDQEVGFVHMNKKFRTCLQIQV